MELKVTVPPKLCGIGMLMLVLGLPSHVSARTILRVSVSQSGLSAEPDDANLTRACKRFKPTAKQVQAFFSKAYPVRRSYAVHERYSGCYATGTVVFSESGEARWSLSSGGAATIEWDTAEIVDVFYPRYGWHDPNACTYGSASAGDC